MMWLGSVSLASFTSIPTLAAIFSAVRFTPLTISLFYLVVGDSFSGGDPRTHREGEDPEDI